ncbi:hypothetical protein [Clostridium pasteurianum]|uniref:Uncharacterized protein n=1 Tax=Clostridium pasteurianum BC1 TaxID=86416 RepID=R4JWI2_CLOPA|nr:hypothetical protein [Clostridium pasteurianum]AGK95187.1 hypothetical protein Clopa_0087 [Clostridium pasteurianum BC1]
MSKLQFINKLNEYRNETITNKSKKSAAIKDMQKKVDDKQIEIDAKQEEYNNNPTNELFQELLVLKQELQKLKVNVKSADEIIVIPLTKTITPEEAAKDIEDFIQGLELEKAREDIGNYKQKFLDSIDVFDDKIHQMHEIKDEIRECSVSDDIKQAVLKVFENHRDVYNCVEEIKLSEQDLVIKRAGIMEKAARLYIRTYLNKF